MLFLHFYVIWFAYVIIISHNVALVNRYVDRIKVIKQQNSLNFTVPSDIPSSLDYYIKLEDKQYDNRFYSDVFTIVSPKPKEETFIQLPLNLSDQYNPKIYIKKPIDIPYSDGSLVKVKGKNGVYLLRMKS